MLAKTRPIAGLLALIDECRKREAAAEERGISDDERARRCDLSREVLDQINGVRPTTLAGVLAVLDFSSEVDDPHHWTDEAIEGLRDLVEGARVMSGGYPDCPE